MTFQVGIRNADGTHFRRGNWNTLTLNVVTSSGQRTVSQRFDQVVPDDGVVRVQIETHQDDDVITVHVND